MMNPGVDRKAGISVAKLKGRRSKLGWANRSLRKRRADMGVADEDEVGEGVC